MNLTIIEHQNKRVLTTGQLSDAYGADSKQISENFTNNKDRYKEGKHYFLLQGEELKSFLQSGIFEAQNANKIRSLYLWTEKGSWLQAKSLNTDRAWEAYETLVDDYYNIKNMQDPYASLSPELKAIFLVDKKTQEIESRVERLENNTSIERDQKLRLLNLAHSVVLQSIGGKESPAYKNSSLRQRTYSALWRDYKEYFEVNSYENTPKKDYEKAKEHLSKWVPQGKLLREIEEANNQLQFTEV